jgi:outer membrane immunogenic protein
VFTFGRSQIADQFKGGYVGINGGGVNWIGNRSDLDGAVNSDLTLVQNSWAGTVGAQIGYNGGSCNTIWGIEVDGNWINGSVNTRLFPNNHIDPIGVDSRLDALVTGRGRAGLVLDNLLLYVTGGIAAARTSTNWYHTDLPVVRTATFTDWRWGWTAGVGTEWAFGNNLSLKTEVLYVNLVDRDYQVGPWFGVNDRVRFSHSDSMWVSRVGLNYRFGGPAVARY